MHHGRISLLWAVKEGCRALSGRSQCGVHTYSSPVFLHPICPLVFICLTATCPLYFAAIFLRSLFLRQSSAFAHASFLLLSRCLSWNQRFRISQLHGSPRPFTAVSLIHKFSYNSVFCGNWFQKRPMWEEQSLSRKFTMGTLYNRKLLQCLLKHLNFTKMRFTSVIYTF